VRSKFDHSAILRDQHPACFGLVPARQHGRVRDQQRTLAPGGKLRIQQQERQAAEMVAMEVRQNDAGDDAP
jgi:hypothetical protein